MKSISGQVLAALVLSTIAWVLLYYAVPDAPPTTAETFLIVFVFTVLAFAVGALLKRRRREANENKPAK